MLVPASFAVAYSIESELLAKVCERADKRISVICEGRWLSDSRLKSAESVLSKLQTGKYPSIEEMHDCYAAMIVVPVKTDIERAIEEIESKFDAVERKPDRPLEPEEFLYNDAHVTAALGPLGPLDPTGLIGERRFEIQVHTGLQYAWWKATHDQVYKSPANWALRRAAAEVRSILENADRSLADLHGEAERIGEIETPNPAGFGEVLGLEELWEAQHRAEDARRFAETVAVYAEAAGLALQATVELVRGEDSQRFVTNSSLTPAQAVMLAIVEQIDAADIPTFAEKVGRVLVTTEMLDASEKIGLVGDAQRVRLPGGAV